MTSNLTRKVRRAIANPDKLVTFVYGTLRPGEGNYWIRDDVLEVIENCTTPGVMYARGIPFCDFMSTEGVIHGTLLIMDRHGDLTRDMIGMEVGAGYKALQVPVKLPGHDRSTVKALAWHYPNVERLNPAYRVPSGNFRDTPGSRYFQRQDEKVPSRRKQWWDDV